MDHVADHVVKVGFVQVGTVEFKKKLYIIDTYIVEREKSNITNSNVYV